MAAFALALLLAFAIALVIAFISASGVANMTPAPAANALDAKDIARSLAGASAIRGAGFVDAYACSVCHIKAGGKVAPHFAGIATRAGQRRAHLTAPEYLRESILQPSAYLAEGFANAMPANYAKRLSAQELADIIAYLLTLS